MFAEEVSFSFAFISGLLSFFSGCVLPLIPAYFTYITGFSLNELTEDVDIKTRSRVMISTLAFITGFSVVFILLGVSATFLGGFVKNHSDAIRMIGGHIIVFFGLHLTGIIRIPFFEFEKRFSMVQKNVSFVGTMLIGMAFAAGWTPCIGPALSSILILAAQKQELSHSILLLGIYSIGFAIPFFLISVFINYIIPFIRRSSKFIPYVNLVSGLLLIILGIMLIENGLGYFSF